MKYKEKEININYDDYKKTTNDINDVIEVVKKNKIDSISVLPVWTKYVKNRMATSKSIVSTIIGYPYGQSTIEVKIAETLDAMENRSDMYEFYLNLAKIKEQDRKYIEKELKSMRESTKGNEIKLILNIDSLTENECNFVFKIILEEDFDILKLKLDQFNDENNKKLNSLVALNIDNKLKFELFCKNNEELRKLNDSKIEYEYLSIKNLDILE